MNCYSNLTMLKRRLDITGTNEDTELLELLNAASRAVDNYTRRWYYVKEETRYCDGSGSPVFLDDILSVTTFKLDEDGDATYESSMASTDYHLYPLNGFPKTWAKLSVDSDYGGFASGIVKGIEIVGTFGYGDGESATPYSDSGDDVESDPLTAAATTCTVNDGDHFAVGQTIRIESEQCYISGIATNTLTISRGANGTTAASHAQNTDIYIYQYPDPIVEATLIQSMRWWKRRESAFQDMVGSPEVGGLVAYKGMDADLELMVKPYIKRGC